MKISIGADHAGYDYKELLKKYLSEKNFEITDSGTYSTDSVDYPDFAHAVARAVVNREAEFGILICGSANGVAIAANRHNGIRAAICWTNEIAELARKHNNANILYEIYLHFILNTIYVCYDGLPGNIQLFCLYIGFGCKNGQVRCQLF